MNELQIFNNEEFGSVRTIEINGKPYFAANDVARALGYTNPSKATNDHCKNAVMRRGNDSLGREQEFKFIPEGDIYRLIVRSNLPSAERFERWVFDEVIPSIRKNGGYIANQENMTREQIVANALIVAQNIIADRDRQIAEMKPKAEFADAIIASNTTILVGDFAKILKQNGIDTGQNRLFKWFVDNHYLFKRNGQYVPTQRAMELELFKIDSKPVRIGDETQIKHTVRVTPQGQKYFINKLLKERNIT